jgi:hypothetical protein
MLPVFGREALCGFQVDLFLTHVLAAPAETEQHALGWRGLKFNWRRALRIFILNLVDSCAHRVASD